MATIIVGTVVVLLVALVIAKLVRDRRNGKGSCSCGSDCSHCSGGCH